MPLHRSGAWLLEQHGGRQHYGFVVRQVSAAAELGHALPARLARYQGCGDCAASITAFSQRIDRVHGVHRLPYNTGQKLEYETHASLYVMI